MTQYTLSSGGSRNLERGPTILVKLKPTDPLQTTVAVLPEKGSPHMVSLHMLATVIFISRVWSPGKNTIVELEVKYSSASCAY